MTSLSQTPAPGARLLHCAGDALDVVLSVAGNSRQGRAFVRTTIPAARFGNGANNASEWRDVEMTPDKRAVRWEVRIPLPCVGTFAFKAYFLPDGEDEPQWPEGNNATVKVAPAVTARSNSIYTAFVRQFSKDDGSAAARFTQEAHAFDTAHWTAIPPSGTFRELARRLDHIIGDLGFHIIQLLPVHPVPTTYARMGRFGSPFASTDFFSVDPALAEFDESATPLDQFVELADSIHARNARLFLDLPANHTGWASTFQCHHPEWFRREQDGRFHSPGAWGVTWADLVELDYSRPEVAEAMADVFLFWCEHGADGFRCDAGYKVPATVWKHIIDSVRKVYPNTVFMLEGLGGELSVTDALLSQCGMDWAYSEIFQQYDRGGLEWYLSGAIQRSEEFGPLVNFAETHDNNRLAAHGECHAMMRTALSALLSQQGCFGITAGVEWFCADKIDVHGAAPLNWGAKRNQVQFISRLNAILDTVPSFFAGAKLRLVTRGGANAIAALRSREDAPASDCLVAVNLDTTSPAAVEWPADRFSGEVIWDLLTGKTITLRSNGGENASLTLPPGGAVALVRHIDALRAVEYCQETRQMRKAFSTIISPVSNGDLDKTIHYRFPVDANRTVMVPPGYGLLIESAIPFRASARYDGKTISSAESAASHDSGYSALLALTSENNTRRNLHCIELSFTGYGDSGLVKRNASILALPHAEMAEVALSADMRRIMSENDLCINLANRRGAASQVSARWSEIRSQYDALLAANTDSRVPANRQIFLSRCRAWLRFRGHSFALDATTQTLVATVSRHEAIWSFCMPDGTGGKIDIDIDLRLAEADNAAMLTFRRRGRYLGPATLILRPDIEARDFHCSTRAYTGPENAFPLAVDSRQDGFTFSPAGVLSFANLLPGGEFHFDPQWQYCVGHPVEASRGLEPDGDLFSPGWFSATLASDGDEVRLFAYESATKPSAAFPASGEATSAETRNKSELSVSHRHSFPDWISGPAIDALHMFIVDRDEHKTVIAGYPWFLDWGRDTLIFLRGLIASGDTTDALEILREFARFEKNGTLPNIIHGTTVGNRDTSDAPLWFIVAAGDLMRAIGRDAVAGATCGNRTIADAILSIISGHIAGTLGGVKVDYESGLVFSPSHFTWMDTNYPAGTPRCGYPVEIQALWLAALAEVRLSLSDGRFASLESKARKSFMRLFPLKQGWLSDCLRAPDGKFIPAVSAIPEDALRPNQLFAITLGAIDPDSPVAKSAVEASARLLVPGAIRSLDDAPVQIAQPIWRDGSLLNDPLNPYWGYYEGDEDTRRKPAYHNGTAWAWPFPAWCEAFAMTTGDIAAARAILASTSIPASQGSIGHLPEICDGNAPHTQRGCLAQAWSLSETIRVWKYLESVKP